MSEAFSASAAVADSVDDGLVVEQDVEMVQATVLSAAISGNPQVRARLPDVLSGFEEPFRTVATLLQRELRARRYVDQQTLLYAMAPLKLRRGNGTSTAEMTPAQVMNLISTAAVQEGQPEAYLGILADIQQQKRHAELQQQIAQLTGNLVGEPQKLLRELTKLVDADASNQRTIYQPEILELIPYVHRLIGQQRGTNFLGLDSGFPHFNSICNGLDTGLSVLAAPPGRGKTTLAWQIACQVATANNVPVIFVSMEQSKEELRAKALARLSGLQYRHILRGHLQHSDTSNLGKLLNAAQEYGGFARSLTVVEGDESTDVDTIGGIADAALSANEAKRCLVVIDYLQILPLRIDEMQRVASSKDRIDLHVSALRRLARRLDSPVMVISAQNRAGYEKSAMDGFKESGAIEYSADIAMVMMRGGSAPGTSESDHQLLDLNIVKNRNGERGVIKFKFYTKIAKFVETGKSEFVEHNEHTG